MAQKAILSDNQQKVLEVISCSKDICQNFYLTGGTALAEFYLQHRFSEDLDFFSENEVDSQTIFSFLKSIKEKTGFEKIDAQQSFNRNLFFLHFPDEIIKTEFTYFPFPKIEKCVALFILILLVFARADMTPKPTLCFVERYSGPGFPKPTIIFTQHLLSLYFHASLTFKSFRTFY